MAQQNKSDFTTELLTNWVKKDGPTAYDTHPYS